MTRTVLQQADDDADIVSAYFPRMAMRPKLGLQKLVETNIRVDEDDLKKGFEANSHLLKIALY